MIKKAYEKQGLKSFKLLQKSVKICKKIQNFAEKRIFNNS